MGAFPELHLTEVDGVPLVWADGPGPPAAGLLLRVGQGDEPVHRRGLTHLLEHLVGDAVGLDRMEAEVGVARTEFLLLGPHEAPAARLTRLCGLLRDPPLDRLEVERRVLQVEDAGNPSNLEALLLLERFGARGPGVVAQPDLGLRSVRGEDVATWAAERCRAGSAVAWLSGAPPADLRLPLPPGTGPPVPARRPRRGLPLPAEGEGMPGQVALGGVLPAGPAATALVLVLRRRLRDHVRRALGLAYSTRVGESWLGDGTVHVRVVADAMEGFGERTRDELVAVLEEVADRGPRIEELALDVAEAAAVLADPSPPAALIVEARSLLAGRPLRQTREWTAALAGVRPEEVQTLARTLLDEAVVLAPEGTRAGRWRTAPPPGTMAVPEGRRFTIGRESTWVVGPDVVAWAREHTVIGVRREHAVALVRNEDHLLVVGDDGALVPVPVTGHPETAELLRAVEELFAGVPLVPRDPGFRPPPAPARWRGSRARSTPTALEQFRFTAAPGAEPTRSPGSRPRRPGA